MPALHYLSNCYTINHLYKNFKKVQFKLYAKYGLYEAAHTSSRFGLQLPCVGSYQIQSKFVQQFRRLNLRNKCRTPLPRVTLGCLFCEIISTTNRLIVQYVQGQKFIWQAGTPKVRTQQWQCWKLTTRKVGGQDEKLTHSLGVQSDGKPVRYATYAANRFNGDYANAPSSTYTMSIMHQCLGKRHECHLAPVTAVRLSVGIRPEIETVLSR